VSTPPSAWRSSAGPQRVQHASLSRPRTRRTSGSCSDLTSLCALLQLNVYPGLKGLKELVGNVPAWIHYEERERVEVRCFDCVLTFPERNGIVPSTERLPLKHVHVCVSALGSGFTMHDEMLLIFRLLSLTRCTCGCSG